MHDLVIPDLGKSLIKEKQLIKKYAIKF